MIADPTLPRGIRNNNPGNIRLGQPWQGLSNWQMDGAFCQFEGMPWGLRAIAVIMRTYARYGLKTPRGIIGRWAPPNENNTGAYVAHVAQALGVGPDDVVDVADPEMMKRLVRAIVVQENGPKAAAMVSDDDIAAGVAMP